MRTSEKGVRAKVKSERKSDNQGAGKKSGKNHADQIGAIIFFAQTIAENTPAQTGDEPNLFEQTRRAFTSATRVPPTERFHAALTDRRKKNFFECRLAALFAGDTRAKFFERTWATRRPLLMMAT